MEEGRRRERRCLRPIKDEEEGGEREGLVGEEEGSEEAEMYRVENH